MTTQEELEQKAREWLLHGGGGHKDGEDGLRAGTWGGEAVVELLADFAAEQTKELRQERDEARRALEYAGNPHTVEDGFGSVWPPCKKHHCSLQVMRPGDARCPGCETEDYVDRLIQRAEAAESRAKELTAAYAELEKAAQFAQEEVEAIGGGHPAGNPVLFRVRERIRTALDRVRKAKTH